MNALYVTLMLVAAGNAKTTGWDFEDAEIGQVPVGWSSARTGKGEGSVWKIAEDKTAPKGPKVLAQTAAGPNNLFNICVADKFKATDLDMIVSLKAVAGKKDQGGGLVWRYQDANNYYVVRANPIEDNFRVYKVVKGKRIQLGTVDIAVASGKWHTIRVAHKGNRIQCYLNGKMHLDVKDDTFKNAGKVGFWTKADARTYFDLFVVQPIRE